MAATAFGLLAVYWADRARLDDRARFPAAGGVAAGLALLAHPFAAVPATQVGLRAPDRPGAGPATAPGRGRVLGGGLAVFSTWGLLIARHPDLFRVQFGNNVLSRAGPGLGSTLRSPGQALATQAGQALERVQPIQGRSTCWAGLGRRPGPPPRRGPRTPRPLRGQPAAPGPPRGSPPDPGVLRVPGGLREHRPGAGRERPGGPARSAAPPGVVGPRRRWWPPGSWRPSCRWGPPGHRVAPPPPGRAGPRRPGDGPGHHGRRAPGRPGRGRRAVRDGVLPRWPGRGRGHHQHRRLRLRGLPFEYAVLGRQWKEPGVPAVVGLEFVRPYGDRGDVFSPYGELYRRARPPTAAPSPATPPPRRAVGVPSPLPRDP